ncbi:MAG: DNA ligase D [Coriobacteriia bacterium]|nr:DNA ligase D [Coriobacteriia bacterium]
MPLDRYRAKRDFSTTPEPAGGAEGGSGRLFVIQKHAASRLHYDFRLELDGVLLSWAVPKGPSLDPRDKRFAARVEDHPVEYGSFEGAIPKGEYGGGTVELWDRGTWEPEGDPHAGLARGDLKFALHGVKLKGGWVLVRMHKRSAEEGKENWLLIKHRDEHAVDGNGDAILTEQPHSVLTGRTIDQIAADPGAVWSSAGSVTELPPIVSPQLATLVTSAPDGEDWLHEIKFDGYRTIARIEDGAVKLESRNGQDWTKRYAPIAEELAALPAATAILDGEVVVQRPDGTTDFGALQADLGDGRTDRLRYAVFDLLHLDGHDFTAAPLHQRKALLAGLLAGGAARTRVTYVDHVRGQGPAFLAQACAIGLEGIVSKRADSPYRPGSRGRDWVKTKCLRREEFVVVGFTPPGGTRTGFGALLLGTQGADGALSYAGRVGTGFTARFLEEFGRTMREIEVAEPSVADGAERAPAESHWVEPRFVAEVSFAERTAAGELRHPSFKGLRDDKTPDEVVAETPTDVSSPSGAAHAAAQPHSATHTASPVTLTNPGRVFWPQAGTTKQDLANYYAWVAPYMLPYVLNRPVSMVRCPHGVEAQNAAEAHPGVDSCFFHKHAGPDFPGPFERVEIVESKGPATYLTITQPDSLRALAQMGVLEIHTWGARWPDIEHPDVVVFDLDPADDVGWRELADAARLVRDVLDGAGLASFVKTTGGKGLHVSAPIVPSLDWDGVKRFAKGIADGIAAYAPERYTATMSKAKREGRVFIDYLRNGRTATFIAPYSTRARARPTVAVPLRWDELDGRIRPDTHDLTTIRRRLAQLDADPWAGYFDLRQPITPEMMGELGLGGNA